MPKGHDRIASHTHGAAAVIIGQHQADFGEDLSFSLPPQRLGIDQKAVKIEDCSAETGFQNRHSRPALTPNPPISNLTSSSMSSKSSYVIVALTSRYMPSMKNRKVSPPIVAPKVA